MCGVVGLKPSRGRLVVNERTNSMPVKIISDGVITRTVRDTAKFYFAAERIFESKSLKPIGLVEGPSKQRLRIGFIFDSIVTKADDETRKAVADTVTALEREGHFVEQLPMLISEQFAEDFTLYWSLLAFVVDRFGKSTFGKSFDRTKLDPLTLGLSKQFLCNFWKAPFVIRRLQHAGKDVAPRAKDFDVIVSPVIAKVTPPLGVLNPGVPFSELMPRLKSFVGYTPIANAIGSPAISLPLGTSSLGLPIGVHLSAPIGEERRLLELAFELEGIKPWKHIYQVV
jgi:amidase